MALSVLCCPICRRETTWESEPRGPFCSERCRLVDLGVWLSEEYAIPDRSADEREDGIPAAETK